jgi:hypothetical protein
MTKASYNLPDGCSLADIDAAYGNDADYRLYAEYVDECRADDIVPMGFDSWVDEQIAVQEREQGRRDAEAEEWFSRDRDEGEYK